MPKKAAKTQKKSSTKKVAKKATIKKEKPVELKEKKI